MNPCGFTISIDAFEQMLYFFILVELANSFKKKIIIIIQCYNF